VVESVRRGLEELKTPGRNCEEAIKEIYRLEFKQDLMGMEDKDVAALGALHARGGIAAVTQAMRDAVGRFISDRNQPF
jgi:hypothetical protein